MTDHSRMNPFLDSRRRRPAYSTAYVFGITTLAALLAVAPGLLVETYQAETSVTLKTATARKVDGVLPRGNHREELYSLLEDFPLEQTPHGWTSLQPLLDATVLEISEKPDDCTVCFSHESEDQALARNVVAHLARRFVERGHGQTRIWHERQHAARARAAHLAGQELAQRRAAIEDRLARLSRSLHTSMSPDGTSGSDIAESTADPHGRGKNSRETDGELPVLIQLQPPSVGTDPLNELLDLDAESDELEDRPEAPKRPSGEISRNNRGTVYPASRDLLTVRPVKASLPSLEAAPTAVPARAAEDLRQQWNAWQAAHSQHQLAQLAEQQARNELKSSRTGAFRSEPTRLSQRAELEGRSLTSGLVLAGLLGLGMAVAWKTSCSEQRRLLAAEDLAGISAVPIVGVLPNSRPGKWARCAWAARKLAVGMVVAAEVGVLAVFAGVTLLVAWDAEFREVVWENPLQAHAIAMQNMGRQLWNIFT